MRPKTAARGYGGAHQARRKRFAPSVERGEIYCRRCGEWIAPKNEPCPRCGKYHGFDMGHDDGDRSLPTFPEHRCCNRATSGRKPRRERSMRW